MAAGGDSEAVATDDQAKGSAPTGADFIIPALAVALVAYYWATTVGTTWEAKVTGVVIGAVLVPLCFYHVVRMVSSIRGGVGTFRLAELVADTPLNRQRLALLALTAAFVAGLEWIGTTAGLFLLLVLSMRVMGVRSLRVLVTVAGVTAATVYILLIYLLSSRLPRGPIENLLASLVGG